MTAAACPSTRHLSVPAAVSQAHTTFSRPGRSSPTWKTPPLPVAARPPPGANAALRTASLCPTSGLGRAFSVRSRRKSLPSTPPISPFRSLETATAWTASSRSLPVNWAVLIGGPEGWNFSRFTRRITFG